MYSVGRRCVYIFNRRKAKKEIPIERRPIRNYGIRHSCNRHLGRQFVLWVPRVPKVGVHHRHIRLDRWNHNDPLVDRLSYKLVRHNSNAGKWNSCPNVGLLRTASGNPRLRAHDLPAFFGPPITGEQRQSAWLSRSRVLLGQREPASPASAHRHPSQHGAAL